MALSWATLSGQETVVKQLIEKQANLKMNCNDEHGHEAVVQQQLERRAGLDVNCKDKRNWAVLSTAAASGQEVVKLLLEKSVNAGSKYQWDQRRYHSPDGRGMRRWYGSVLSIVSRLCYRQIVVTRDSER